MTKCGKHPNIKKNDECMFNFPKHLQNKMKNISTLQDSTDNIHIQMQQVFEVLNDIEYIAIYSQF